MGVRARECAAQSWRALPCFIFWAGPGLIPHLPRGLSGAHIEGDRGPAALRRKTGGPLHQAWEGLRCGGQSGPVHSTEGCPGSVGLTTLFPEGVPRGVWHLTPEPTEP